jgi:hypothetical protein
MTFDPMLHTIKRKNHSFVECILTRVHSTQRNKSYYIVVKTKLYKHLFISEAVYIIADQTADLGRKYNAEISRNWRSLLQLQDKAAFTVVSDKFIHYALGIVMHKWSTTKVLGDDVEDG